MLDQVASYFPVSFDILSACHVACNTVCLRIFIMFQYQHPPLEICFLNITAYPKNYAHTLTI